MKNISLDAEEQREMGTPNFVQENQAIKRQKLEAGKIKQIISIKTHYLPHKARVECNSNLVAATPSNSKSQDGEIKTYVREPAPTPLISMAETTIKFHPGTSHMNIPPHVSSLSHGGKRKLTLTRPKEPELETSQHVSSTEIKSSADLHEEIITKIPKFKKLKVNRKNHQWKPHVTPKTPLLQTSLRARHLNVKSSEELELEELEKAPKFKARPLNKKIFESKGELGLFWNTKRQVTIPQEFHFATDERIPPPTTATDFSDYKLSFCFESQNKTISGNRMPNRFHERRRGAGKENKYVMEVKHKQIKDERAAIQKANTYCDPLIPEKLEPRQCIEPEHFQLEKLVKHEEEEKESELEERRLEEEEARMKICKTQAALKEDPIPAYEKVRRPLTEVQEFDLHVPMDKGNFDKKVKEKEMYNTYPDEAEAAKMVEKEKAFKRLRTTVQVPEFNQHFLTENFPKGLRKAKSPRLKTFKRKERRNMVAAAGTSSAASRMR